MPRWRCWPRAAVGFSFGVWVYSVSPDGYLPPLFLALLALVMLDPQSWQDLMTARPSVWFWPRP